MKAIAKIKTLSAFAAEGHSSIAEIITGSKKGDSVHVHGEVISQAETEGEYIIADETGKVAVDVKNLDIKLNLGTEIDVFGTVSPDSTPTEVEIDATKVEILQE